MCGRNSHASEGGPFNYVTRQHGSMHVYICTSGSQCNSLVGQTLFLTSTFHLLNHSTDCN